MPTYSRRQVLAGGFGAALGLGIPGHNELRERRHATIEAAASVKAAGSDLGAVKHVVFLMQENRSFDHYFGRLGGVEGFGSTTNRSAFAQPWPGGASRNLLPFHLDTKKELAECTYDLSHSWAAAHGSWNGGAMDGFVSTHTSRSYEGPLGVVTMGYYGERDIPFYYDLAKNFTICDQYFCSVLGPTHPNRLMQMTGTIDPAGLAGGPILVTNESSSVQFSCSWTTMPEVLQDAGISWKVYNPHGSFYQPRPTWTLFLNKNVLMYFTQYQDPTSVLHKNAFGYYGPNVVGGWTDGTSPNDFASDVANGTLPAVSWIMPPVGYDEHPPAPPALGEWYSQQVLNTLVSNPDVWASTVLFIMYDENDGFFDHYPPPTSPHGTEGEYLTVDPLPADAQGVAGPIGLGVRVPMLVVSPFSVGGWVCSDVFDHTSQLRFLESLFPGVRAPNISSWRRTVTNDLTTALPVLGAPVYSVPKLPLTSESTTAPPVGGECTGAEILEGNPVQAVPMTVPRRQRMPRAGKGTLKRVRVTEVSRRVRS